MKNFLKAILKAFVHDVEKEDWHIVELAQG